MAKLCTIKLNKEFKTAYYHGRVFVHPLVVLYVRKNKVGECRYGITTGKKVGGAVQRNRCRRIIRAAYASLYPSLRGKYDLVFVARAATAYSNSNDMTVAMRSLLTKAGLLV